MRAAWLLVFMLQAIGVIAQDKVGKLLILSNVPGQVLLDGQSIGAAEPNTPIIRDASTGDHLVQLAWNNNGRVEVQNEVVTIEAGMQKIVHFNVEVSASNMAVLGSDTMSVADLNVAIPGGLVVGTWQSDHPGEEYPYPTFYYAFEKGDLVVLDVTMSNAKGTNIIEVVTHPGNVTKYSNRAFSALRGQTFRIDERCILRISLATNHTFDRNGFVRVRRVPASAETRGFNTNVVRKTVYTPVQVCEKQEFFVNSSTNLTGTTRIALPVSLPSNTVEWYYRFSAFREQADIDRVQETAGLFAEIASAVVSIGGGALLAKGTEGIISRLTQPPGADFCDIQLLDQDNRALFEAKMDYRYYPDASRENFKSGNVRVNCCPYGQWYLGVRNNDTMYGVHVLLEVVAITAIEDWVMEGYN